MAEFFEWPCERRDAHGPHPKILGCSKCRDDGPTHANRCDRDVVYETCPGVKAHPDTMIGRASHG